MPPTLTDTRNRPAKVSVQRLTPETYQAINWDEPFWPETMRSVALQGNKRGLELATEAAITTVDMVVVCNQIFPIVELIACPRALFTDPESYGMAFDDKLPFEARVALFRKPGQMFAKRLHS